MKSVSPSVIVPIFNEGRTIASVIEIIRTWGGAREIIVVDDEATRDDTQKILERFGDGITVLKNRRGRGKGDAVATGIKRAAGELLLLIDGDITSLTHNDLEMLVEPVVCGRADMAIGVLRYWRAGGYEPFSDISGTRVLRKTNVASHLSDIQKSGYGVEILFNDLHKDKRIEYVRLPYVFVLNKFEKQVLPDAIGTYLREARELIAETIRRTGDLPPQMKPVLRGVQDYLKRALDYLQLE